MNGIEAQRPQGVPKPPEAQGARFNAMANLGAIAHQDELVRRGRLQEHEPLSHKEKSERLFSGGTIQQGLRERILRIDSYSKWIKAGRDINHPDINPNAINPDEARITEDEKNKRSEEKSFRERMISLLDSHSNEQNLEEHIKDNFFDLQKWIGVILKNSKQNGGKLTIEDKSYEAFKILKNLKVKSFWGNPERFLQALEDYRFLEYFPGETHFFDFSYDPERGKNLDQPKSVDGSHQPITLEGIMKGIANQHGRDFQPGGKYELLDKHGDFRLGNFITWVRIQSFNASDFSPTSPLDLLEGPMQITSKANSWGALRLFDILFYKDYMQQSDFMMSGKLGELTAGWSELKEHPIMTAKIREEILIEVWKTGLVQTFWAHLNSHAAEGDMEKWIEAFKELSNANNDARYAHGIKSEVKMSANGVDNAKDCLQNNKRGSLGRAWVEGLAFFRHFTELTDYYFDNNTGRVINFRENMAYKQLGPEGSSYFLQSMAENSLGSENTLGKRIKERYKKFIYDIMDDIGESSLKSLKQAGQEHHDTHETINNLVNSAKKNLSDMELKDLSISFEKNENLIKLWQGVQEAMGKKVVSQKHMYKYGLSGDEFVTYEQLGRDVQLEMRGRLDYFLESALYAESTDGFSLGDMEVYVAGGRIVNEEECRKAMRISRKGKIPYSDLEGSGRITIREVVNDFMVNYEDDMRDLEIIKKYEKRRRAKEHLPGYVADTYDDHDYTVPAYVAGAADDTVYDVHAHAYQEAMGRIEKIHVRQERFAFAMFNKVAGLNRRELNIFSKHMPSSEARKILGESMIKSFMEKYGFNYDEARYLYNVRILYYLAQSGMEGWNNTSTSRTGINQLTKLLRYKGYLLSDHALSKFNKVGAILAFGPPTLFDSVMVDAGDKKVSLLDYLQGDYDLNEASLSYQHQSAFAEIIKRAHLMSEFLGAKQLLIEGKHITTGPLGEPIVNHEELEKRLGIMYDATHYAFDNGDYDYKKIIAVDGQKKTLLEHMLSKKTIKSIQIIKKDWEDKANSIFRSKEEKEMYARYAREIDQKPGTAVFMSVLMDMINDRTRLNSHYQRIGVAEIKHIRWAIEHYLRSADKDKNTSDIKDDKKMPPLVDDGLFGKLLEVQGRSMEELAFWELLYVLFAILLATPKHATNQG